MLTLPVILILAAAADPAGQASQPSPKPSGPLPSILRKPAPPAGPPLQFYHPVHRPDPRLVVPPPPPLYVPPPPPMVTKPIWVQVPIGDEMQRVYPGQAQQARLGGEVIIRCFATGEGRLTDCTIAEEIPPGYGFGEAALQLADRFKMERHDLDGQSVGYRPVNVPIKFSPADVGQEHPPRLYAPAPPPLPPGTPVPPPAPPPPIHKVVITNPDWVSRPSSDDIARVYPKRALDEGVGGHATMRCEVTGEGKFTACAIVEETPSGYGFGEALLLLADRFRLPQRTADGRSVEGGQITVPVTFNLDG